MKFIHTSDWHLGRILHGVHLTQDQALVLDDFIGVLKKEKPDALIIAGDIYDRGIPPVEAVALFSRFTQTVLLDLGIPIIAMAGNHDSGERIQFGSKLLSETKLHIIGKSKQGYEKITLQDEHGPVEFYVIPYADPAEIRILYKMDHIMSHNDSMASIVDKILEENIGERSVAIAHAYVQGGNISSDSERPLSIGGTDMVSADHFKHFNYTALGHLHAPQRVGEEYIRYSGSLMKYSSSEATQRKCVYMVEIDEQGKVTHEEIFIKPPRDLRKVKGLLNDILATGRQDENPDDYIVAIVEDEGALLDTMGKIRSVYPNAIEIERPFLKKQRDYQEENRGYTNHNKMSIGALFTDFYTNVTGEEFNKEYQEVFQAITKGIERE